MGKKVAQKVVENQYGKSVKVCLFKNNLGFYTITVNGNVYASEIANELYAMQKFNEI